MHTFLKAQILTVRLEEEINWLDKAKRQAPQGLVKRLQSLQDKRQSALDSIVSAELTLPDAAKEFAD